MFAKTYQQYLEVISQASQNFGFEAAKIAEIEPILAFLYKNWWQVDLSGLNHLPAEGPALIVGNAGGVLPWPGMMLIYALMNQASPRRLNIMCDMDWIEDQRIYTFLTEIGFVPFSSSNAKELWSQGELVVMFPEGISGMTKPFAERYRVFDFDWTKLLPAVESGIKIIPIACLGCEESVPVFSNVTPLARLLKLPAFPITPFFPWLPYPLSLLLSLPGKWKMHILKASQIETPDDRDQLQNKTKQLAHLLEGEIQAELNRLLRSRIKAI